MINRELYLESAVICDKLTMVQRGMWHPRILVVALIQRAHFNTEKRFCLLPQGEMHNAHCYF